MIFVILIIILFIEPQGDNKSRAYLEHPEGPAQAWWELVTKGQGKSPKQRITEIQKQKI